MKITIRLSTDNDVLDYTTLLQQTYEVAYVDDSIGLTKECFSREIFQSPETQKYLLSNLQINEKQKCWLAFTDDQLVGSITIVERDNDYELRGFYVAVEHQNQGIGKRLWNHVIKFVKDKDITCDIYVHNRKTIEMYKKWGFVVDTDRGEFYRHWTDWPENVKAKCIYMRYKVT